MILQKSEKNKFFFLEKNGDWTNGNVIKMFFKVSVYTYADFFLASIMFNHYNMYLCRKSKHLEIYSISKKYGEICFDNL